MKMKAMIVSMFVLAFATGVSAMNIEFADSTWNGIKIPDGQQCQKFGGAAPATPKLIISEIPAGADALVLEYSDRDSKKMNNGGHGIMKFTLQQAVEKVELPPVPGHTFELPAPFTMIEPHRSPGWDKAGAYMPPCSGGKGHAYYVTIKAMKDDQVLTETVFELGTY